LDIGDFVGAKGSLFRTRTGEPTIEVEEFKLLAKALRPLPEKWHGLSDIEKRFRQRYLDIISNDEVKATFYLRSKIIESIRNFFNDRGFIEVETPVLVPVAAGAMARPFITQHNALDRQLYLRIATELYLKRLIIGGIDKVYEIGRVFRNEGVDVDHNPEFTLLESYEAYADYTDVMNMVEQLIYTVATKVLGKATVEINDTTLDFTPPWRRVSLQEEIFNRTTIDFLEYSNIQSLAKKMNSLGLEVERHVSWGRLLDKLISMAIEPHLIQPTFLIDYPVEMSPLAKRKPGNEKLVERFEGFALGMEIANSFTELNDPLEQRQRMEEQENLHSKFVDEDIDRMDEDFLVALEHGMPPTGGLGMGIDRLVMLLTGHTSIREAILFPQLRTK
jgi:lysyl-tRNA synthetase class 2